MNSLLKPLPISPHYRSTIFDALALQTIFAILSLMILDGGQIAQFCGATLLAFWGGVLTLIVRHPQSPTYNDIQWIRFGCLPAIILTSTVVQWVWHLRGVA